MKKNAEKGSNVMLVMTDQHRLSAMGCYGRTPCQTPCLNRFADEGIVFENAYTTCPVCSPARGSIMTGQYPHRHGITANLQESCCAVHSLEDRPELLSRQLEKAGYQMGYSGKWHLGAQGEKTRFDTTNCVSLPSSVGFEGQDFPGHGGGGFGYQEYKDYLQTNGFSHRVLPWEEKTKEVWPMGILDGPVESTVPYFLVENTISLLKKFHKSDKPFFMWHNFWGPHGPFYVPRKYLDMYQDVEIPEWPNYHWDAMRIDGPHQNKVHPEYKELEWEDWANAIRYYYAFATLIDEQCGRLFDFMRNEGIIDETTVIFTADHGQTLGSHGGLTDKGWHHFEETHRIPFVIRLPEAQQAGRRETKLVSLADVYPTVLNMAGQDCPKEHKIDGKSLLPLIENPDCQWRNCVVTEFHGLSNAAITMRTLRWEDYKYGYNVVGKDELYDLNKDPFETTNLIDSPAYVNTRNAMQDMLLEWLETTQDGALTRYKLKYSRSRPIKCRAPA